ncbi:hypothetical protein [Amycolatopsis sp. BJA-103]|uniref:hypothetical protein n=1 Tax=Amycolatopsis sp. BJA-103 TaxID=1911175 RepID=UPI000C7634A0|nr:hypothetical protein [Amycolatopsis sp. BJA-103]AUI62164.1 hypothetical protein BKN51_31030 [Amycolatopsis sp. BJA-103]
MTRKQVIVPPFRDLDPELGIAERLLAQGNPWLAGVELVAFGGRRRIKRCAVCAEAFCDRTAGCSRRWCAGHRPHADSRPGGVH